NLAIHMDREVNEKGAPIDNQKQLLPMLGMVDEALNTNTKFVDLLADKLGVDAKDILDYDLCIYNLDEPQLVGIKEEFISAPRLDDITSCSALIHGLIDSSNADRVNLVCLFDNEEIGNVSKQGADSTLANIIIQKIWQSFGKNAVDCMTDISDGLMISVDVAHAYHPNHPALQDITNFPVLNKGFVLKSASNQSYAWDAEILGSLLDLCGREEIPVQRFVKHSNVKGGGTIASVSSSHLPMRTADLGVGLLAMHSSCEMTGLKDQVALAQFAKAFFEN
ncbi:MAG: M18 family aminopeptidase, partial [Agathobacter sp.]|nr:M18 family aminopeptidase [Agathobacter sp.]